MKAIPLILLLTAAPAFAGDGMFAAWHRDCDQPRGPVDRWPQVVRARDIARLCPAQQFAIIEGDKRALEAASPSLYRPNYAIAIAPAPPAEPAPAPPPPAVPSTDRPATPATTPADRPAPPAPEGRATPSPR